jgi:hypothetical protein
MSKFRKKPVVIEAVLCSDAIRLAESDWLELPKWLRSAYEKGGVLFTEGGIYLPTLEGSMLAQTTDWIICGVKGEVYPCKPDIFEATYEPFEEKP